MTRALKSIHILQLSLLHLPLCPITLIAMQPSPFLYHIYLQLTARSNHGSGKALAARGRPPTLLLTKAKLAAKGHANPGAEWPREQRAKNHDEECEGYLAVIHDLLISYS